MSSDLDLLIDFYQWEKQRLLLEIEENKRDGDFLAVHHGYEQLRYLHKEYEPLAELKNPNYPRIKILEWRIELYSKKNQRYHEDSDLNNQRVNQYRKELDKIKQEKTPSPSEETQFIDEALYALLNNDIGGFVLYLDLQMGTRIDFTKPNENQIQISLKVDDENDASRLKKDAMNGNPVLKYDEASNSLTKIFKIMPNKNVLPIKEAVSKIVIGSKGFLRSEGKIYLKLKP